MRNRILLAAFASFALAAAAFAQAPQAPGPAKSLLDLVREARAARLAGNHQVWRDAVSKALELAPDHPDLLLSAARAEAALGNADAALHRLGDAVLRGAGLDLSQMQEFAKLRIRRAFATLARRARENADPVVRAAPFTLLRKDSQSEGIAYDPASRRLFAGSVQGEIFAIDEKGAVTTFIPPGTGLREVYGLKVDPDRRLLWAVTTVFTDAAQQPGAPPKAGIGVSGLFAFSLTDRGLVTARWLDERPAQHGFNDIALALNGDVYVTDSSAGAVYVLRSNAPRIELFVRDPRFSFPNGIVVTPDQRYLIVATVEGLNRIDLGSRVVTRLRVPNDASVNSIDGLVWHGADLIGVQSSPYMSRIIRIAFDRSGEAVTSVTVLNSYTPREYAQTTAAVGGDQVYVVGGTPAADAAGKPLAAEPKPQIVRISLASEPVEFLGMTFE